MLQQPWSVKVLGQSWFTVRGHSDVCIALAGHPVRGKTLSVVSRVEYRQCALHECSMQRRLRSMCAIWSPDQILFVRFLFSSLYNTNETARHVHNSQCCLMNR
jgi:hypothetical protein